MHKPIFCLTILMIHISLAAQPVRQVQTLMPEIVTTIPHDPEAFTQGLICLDSLLYESTGLVGKSSLQKLDLKGNILKRIQVPEVFAEGIAVLDGELVQLTWQEGIAIRYQFPSLTTKGTYHYEGEGWGLSSDSSQFIMSNGSDSIYFRNSRFEIERAIQVTLNGKPISQINELEFVNGKIYANVWFQNFIVEISPMTGKVNRIINCSELVKREQISDPNQVLNGIAYCKGKRLWYLTGKNWHNIYVVRIPD